MKTNKLAIIFVLSILLAGCWDNTDLTDINIVTALGIDKDEDGKIIVTVQVVEPAAVPLTSSSNGGGAGQTKPVSVKSYKGETIYDALISMKSIVDKRLFLSTVQVLVLGERFCKDGINDALDYLHRNNQAEYLADVLVARGTSPEQILNIQADMDVISALYIKGTVENTAVRAKVERKMLIELFKEIKNKCRQITIGQITKLDGKTVKTEGTAVFRDGKLVGWLDQYQTRGYLFVADKVGNPVISFSAPESKISIEIIQSTGKKSVIFKNGEPARLSVQIRLEGNIGEYIGKEMLSKPEDIHKIEKMLSEEVKKEINMALNKAQKDYSSDIFGFGEYVHKYYPKYWKKAMDEWNDVFSRLPADIRVEAKIRHTGLIKSPMKKDE
ncbi:MAG: Ger(x)C family spore germination protein [Clostridiales bacterium]|nr:Ger(x)C family spore germination protein [Clostridiales bacterium]